MRIICEMRMRQNRQTNRDQRRLKLLYYLAGDAAADRLIERGRDRSWKRFRRFQFHQA